MNNINYDKKQYTKSTQHENADREILGFFNLISKYINNVQSGKFLSRKVVQKETAMALRPLTMRLGFK